MNDPSHEWRKWLFLGRDEEAYNFAIPALAPPGIPGTATHEYVVPDGPLSGPYQQAACYWSIREGWRGFGGDEFEAVYRRWQPKRDAILGKEEHLGKTRTEWELFFLALGDERVAREYALGKFLGAFGPEITNAYMEASAAARLKKNSEGGRAG